jgi:GNAT superfamily N-acetyltransferase
MGAQFLEVERPPYTISTDPCRLDLAVVSGFLEKSYWAEGIPRDVVDRAIKASLCFGLYEDAQQVGYARVITDRATYAYLCDVFVIESCRGQGLARWMMEVVLSHPDLQGLRRFCLATRDAHGLYRKFGFSPLASPDSHMEILRQGIYLKSGSERRPR